MYVYYEQLGLGLYENCIIILDMGFHLFGCPINSPGWDVVGINNGFLREADDISINEDFIVIAYNK